MDMLSLSIVVPVYAGETYLADLVESIKNVDTRWKESSMPLSIEEVIFVDDCSIDESSVVLEKLSADFPWIRIITLSRNYGQHAATIAGILHASGDWIATMDEDLQHPAELLEPMLVRALGSSSDLVYVNAKGAIHQNWIRDLSSRLYKGLISRITGVHEIRNFSSFRLIRGQVARAAASVCGHAMYLDVVLTWFTTRITTLNTDLKDRRYIEKRKSGYSLGTLLSHARRLIISTQTNLLRLGVVLGLTTMLASLVITATILILKIFFQEQIPIQGWASTMVLILFFGGLSSFLLGIALEYIGVILLQGQGKPTFFVVDRSLDDTFRYVTKVLSGKSSDESEPGI